jgi:mannose-6-phosphate isomerase
MRALHGPIQRYAWGSRSAIALLQGRPAPTDTPEAELWLGAHPSAPSTVDSVSLVDVVAADPSQVLGPDVAGEFEGRLPFLLKVLAAEEPLSLQAHPDAAQARAGYAAGNPSYVDPYHKPELLVAVSEFEVLCGFRAPDASARHLASLGIPALSPVISLLEGGHLRAATTALLESSFADAVAGADPLAARLAARNPGDPGVVVALLLNHVTLRPGEAIWMPAGNLHAYLHGTGIEIMAASDNVLRGGLTPKRVDVPELRRILRFEVLEKPVVPAVPVSADVVTWPVPVRDFALYRVTPGGQPVQLAAPGPRIVLCLRGSARVSDGVAVTLGGGEAAFGAASSEPLVISGVAEVYVATTPSTKDESVFP